MLIVMRCTRCRRKVSYWAEDLVRVVGYWHEAHVPPWPCGRCRTREYMVMRWRIPSTSELQARIVVRRPVKQITKWVWQDEMN